jgi:hypothetical protein
MVQGAVRVESLNAGQSVVLKGLAVNALVLDAAALTLIQNQGSVRAENLDLFGGVGAATHPAWTAAYLDHCADVAFTNCYLQGGFGGEWPNEGGGGIQLLTSSVAIDQCSLVGGTGAHAPAGASAKGSRGGTGFAALQSLVFASGIQFFGGQGGNGSDAVGDCTQGGVAPGDGGDGGYGLVLHDATDDVRLVPGEVGGGPGGARGQGISCGASDGSAGPDQYVEPGATLTIADAAPTLLLCPETVTSGDPIQLFVYGEPGARVTLLIGAAPGFFDGGGLRGIQLATQPVRRIPLGVMPATGFIAAQLPAPVLPAGVDAQTWYLQNLVHNAQGARWSGPTTLVVHGSSF